jgi:hypothetical protein
MNPRADTTVGTAAARVQRTTRRGTPWQDRYPLALWTAIPVAAAVSQGPPPAHPRHATSTREHQTGGAPTRTAPTRRAHQPRPPPSTFANHALLPAPPPDHPLLAERVKDASGVARDRLRRSLTRSPTRSLRRRSRQGAD